MTKKFAVETQLQVWSLINDLCNVTQIKPEEFRADIHVQKAQEIIDTIDDAIDYSSVVQLQYRSMTKEGDGDSPFCMVQGGSITEEKEQNWGADERRIGHYLVQKRGLRRRISRLTFQYFKSSDVWNLDNHSSLYTILKYYRRSKELFAIYTSLYEPYHLQIGPLTIIWGRSKDTYFWRKDGKQ